ncbi:MAG TPA: choice-of-anchor P family protein [Jatrophihabitantaceae bacterium]|nr:choice-of-anchor P family protein [Jatrophihabitantaceae bacterium]
MSTWRTLGAGLIATVLAFTAVVVSTQNTANADPDNPTFITGELPPLQHATAFALGTVGLTPLTLYPNATCARGQSKSKSLASVTIPGVLSASALNASCSLSTDGTVAAARATVGQLSLLGGRVKVSLLDARCTRSADGTATVGATWGSLITDQNYARNGAGAIVVPGVGQVLVNDKWVSGFGYAETLVVQVFAQVVGGVTVVPDSAFVISGCILDDV